jgi:ABC-2 type transport system ATP-binding protein
MVRHVVVIGEGAEDRSQETGVRNQGLGAGVGKNARFPSSFRISYGIQLPGEGCAQPHMTNLVELENVTKTYGRVVALRDLSVQLPPGAIGLLGPNGAGKTTMIRTLLGLITIDSGRGTVLGMEIRSQPLDIRQSVGFVPEDECLFPAVVGIEFVAYAGELAGMSRKDAMQRAHEVLDYVGLGEARYRPVESYSSGMKQRLKLGSAIVHDPRLLILDEPTNGMDPQGREDIVELSRDLAHNKGMSLLFSSHLLPDVEAVCDYVMVLGQGRLLAQGLIKDLKRAHDHVYEVRVKADQDKFERYLTEAGCSAEPNGDGLLVKIPKQRTQELLWETAYKYGHQIRFLRPRRSTLEEVFLHAVSEQD